MFGKPSLWSLGRRKTDKENALKDKISLATYILETTIEKLKSLTQALSNRDGRYFEQCISAVVAEDSARALMYANECAEVRRLVSLVMSSQLALEKACLRLNTVGTVSEILTNITPMLEVVTETGRRLKGIIPSITGKLQQVDNVLKASISDIGTVPDPQKAGQEVKNILEEAGKAAEDAVRNKFPEFPSELTAELEKPRVPVAIAEGVGETLLADAMTDQPFKDTVYDYLKKRNGHLSIAECATDLGITPKEVEQIILELKDEGKVAL
jgi:division protein CdvB (Snf7/Vps24/ESCRT-III family)